jgi:hypothetical protein
LLNKDKCGDICLGSDEANIVKNINVIKVVRTSRLVSFHDNNSDMFLPASIVTTGEEMAGRTHNYDEDDRGIGSHSNEDTLEESPWSERCSLRKIAVNGSLYLG